MRWVGLSIASGALWNSFYVALQQRYNKRLASHVVSLCHSITSVLLITLVKLTEGRGLLYLDFYRPNRPHEEIIMAFSLGYFLYDTSIMRKSISMSPMALHHIGSCTALTTVLQSGQAGTSVLVVIFLLEGSNPVLHVRRILQHYKLDKGILYFVFELFYLALFLLFRFGLAGAISYDIFTGKTKCQPMHFCIAVFFNVVSCIFLGVITLYIGKKYFNWCKDINSMK